jgi:hypothetical protein
MKQKCGEQRHEATEGSYIQCGPFSKEQNSEIPLGELGYPLAAWFKEAYASSISIDSGVSREKALQITPCL